MNMNINEINALRTELIRISADWSSDSKPQRPSDIFFLSSHIRALELDRPLVIGMRGAGKSFWSEVLTDDSLRTAVTKRVKGYDTLTNVCSIRWDQGNAFSDHLPEFTVIEQALKDGLKPQQLWLSLILNELRAECNLRDIEIKLPPSSQGWAGTLRWAKEHPDAIRSSIGKLNAALNTEGKSVLIVIDALDRMAANLAQSVECLRGLLQLLLDARQLKGLRFKVFLREDMTNMSSVLSFPDASKLMNEAVHLSWTREDIYALHLHKLAQNSNLLQESINARFGPPQRRTNGYWHSVLIDFPFSSHRLTDVLNLLAPPYMGKTATKGHVYSWWYKHLADGKGRVSPRTFASSLAAALNASFLSGATHVLMPKGIQQGVRVASEARIKELGEDYFWVRTALSAFNERPTPVSVREIYGVWNGGGLSDGIERRTVPQVIREECQARTIFVPWDESALNSTPSQKLRDTLVDLGVLTLRDEDTRLDMPDIYRLGYQIRKRGGVSPRR
jgi:hypothetical protein